MRAKILNASAGDVYKRQLFSYFFYTPKMYRILRDNRETVIKYRILQDRIRTAQQLSLIHI